MRPGHHERFFLNQLESNGIATGPYYLPDWEDSPLGFQRGLNSLFDLTPPTALIAGAASLFYPILQFLGNRGLQVPKDVSLVCGDADPGFDWCRPTVAHMYWNPDPMVGRIVHWANNVGPAARSIAVKLSSKRNPSRVKRWGRRQMFKILRSHGRKQRTIPPGIQTDALKCWWRRGESNPPRCIDSQRVTTQNRRITRLPHAIFLKSILMLETLPSCSMPGWNRDRGGKNHFPLLSFFEFLC